RHGFLRRAGDRARVAGDVQHAHRDRRAGRRCRARAEDVRMSDWNTDALTAPTDVPERADNPAVGEADPAKTAELQPKIVDAIKTVFDPEIPVDIYELGLIYDIWADADANVAVKMTLTSPACPSAQQIPNEVRWK